MVFKVLLHVTGNVQNTRSFGSIWEGDYMYFLSIIQVMKAGGVIDEVPWMVIV